MNFYRIGDCLINIENVAFMKRPDPTRDRIIITFNAIDQKGPLHKTFEGDEAGEFWDDIARGATEHAPHDGRV